MGSDGILAALDAIDPAALDYQEWLNVGMALKHEGLGAEDFDAWSRRDSARYVPGECARKWAGFAGTGVTGGTIVHLARGQGFRPSWEDDTPIGWDDAIGDGVEPPVMLLAAPRAPAPPAVAPMFADGEQAAEAACYLEALFDADDYVNVVTQSYRKGNRAVPANKGVYTKTAGQLLEGLAGCNGDLGRVFGDWDPEAGAWCRINPLDGAGIGNANVAEHRYCLIESDDTAIDEQCRIITALRLPVAALVHSGAKSLHAVVHVGAADRRQYDERVALVTRACNANGLAVDASNKNPARLSRLPGVTRAGRRQYLAATHIGAEDFDAWLRWHHEQTDGLPDAVSLADEFAQDVPGPDVLIEGMLAAGEKMLLAGPSKAGKSFALMQLCVALAEGGTWMGRRCAQAGTVYVNLELKPESRRSRMQNIYHALGLSPENTHRIHSMDLRGRRVTLERLTAKLVKQAASGQVRVVVVDPIYKVLEGDENSSEDVARFCRALDYLIEQLGVSVVYCHHYSKGAAGYSNAMNRASGSSVFGRDADALVTMDEVELDKARRTERLNRLGCTACKRYMDGLGPAGWEGRLRSLDDMAVLDAMRAACVEALGHGSDEANALIGELEALEAACMASLSAWRVEAVLRDFPRPAPIDVWYQWPLHIVDRDGALSDAGTEADAPMWKKAKEKYVSAAPSRRDKRQQALRQALDKCAGDGHTTVAALAKEMGVTVNTVRGHIAESGFCSRDGGKVVVQEDAV